MVKPTLGIQPIDFSKYWNALHSDMIKILFHCLSPHHRPKYNWERLYQLTYRICTGSCYHLGIVTTTVATTKPNLENNKINTNGNMSKNDDKNDDKNVKSDKSDDGMMLPRELNPPFTCVENGPQPKLLYYLIRKSIEVYMRDHLLSQCYVSSSSSSSSNASSRRSIAKMVQQRQEQRDEERLNDEGDDNEQKLQKQQKQKHENGQKQQQLLLLSGVDLLKFFVDQWESYMIGISILNGIFTYLNRDFIVPNQTRFTDTKTLMLKSFSDENDENVNDNDDDDDTCVYSIPVLCHLLFRNVLFEPIRDQLQRTVLELIEQNREMGPEQFDEYLLLERYVKSISQLGFDGVEWYEHVFERGFIRETEQYYRVKCTHTISSMSIPQYVSLMIHYLKLEEKISGRYLRLSTKPKLMNTCVQHMIYHNENVLFGDHLNEWFTQWEQRVSDLNQFYTLVKYSKSALLRLRDQFQTHVRETVEDQLDKIIHVVGGVDMWKNAVDMLIESYDRATKMTEQVFERDAEFILARDAAFKSIFCYAKNCEEWFAKKTNLILRGGGKLNEEENESQLNTILKFYTLLSSGDAFIRFYAYYFGQRLLQGNFSRDNEAAMLGKLKQMCSFVEVYKLQRMFNDIHLSDDLNHHFRAYLASSTQEQQQQQTKSIDFSCTILTLGSWPLFTSSINCVVPRPIEPMMNQFAQFYEKQQYKGRKLQWAPAVSRGVVKSNCWDSPYEFQVSQLHLAVLLLFNDKTEYTVEELERETEMEKSHLHPTLRICHSAKILLIKREGTVLSDGKNLSVESNDRVSLNFEFSSKRLRMSLAQFTREMKEATHTKVVQQIDNDRKFVIQAIIVRIMKSRRTLSHRDLVSSVLSQLQQFKPSLADIKKNIEHLIEMDHLARNAENKEMYDYVA